MLKTQRLLDVIKNIEEFPWNKALFLAGQYPWNEDTPCAILDPDDSDDPDEDPEPARQQGLKYTLSVQDVQGVVENAKEQDPNVSLRRLLDAFNFYYRNDAYIEL